MASTFGFGRRLITIPVVFCQQFTGDGADKTFQLTGTDNGTFSMGAWTVGNVANLVVAHVTLTNYKPAYDSANIFTRHRIGETITISDGGLVTLDYAPRAAVDFIVWYWYVLEVQDIVTDYYRRDFIAKMEADTGSSLASQVSVDTTTLTNNLNGITGDSQSMFEAVDNLVIASGTWNHYDVTLSSDTFAASGPGIYTITSEGGVTDALTGAITGLSSWDEITVFAAAGHTITITDGTHIKCKYDFAISGTDCATLLHIGGNVCVIKGYKSDNE